jgi:hypothetical protein
MRKALLLASAGAVAVCGFGFSIAGATPAPPTTECPPIDMDHSASIVTLPCPPPTTEAPPETTAPKPPETNALELVVTPAAPVASTPQFTG